MDDAVRLLASTAIMLALAVAVGLPLRWATRGMSLKRRRVATVLAILVVVPLGVAICRAVGLLS